MRFGFSDLSKHKMDALLIRPVRECVCVGVYVSVSVCGCVYEYVRVCGGIYSNMQLKVVSMKRPSVLIHLFPSFEL